MFAIRNLSVLSYAQGFTLWHYRGPSNTLAEVLAPGFFNQAQDMIPAGDMMHVTAQDGGATLFVTLSSWGVVTVVTMARTPELVA